MNYCIIGAAKSGIAAVRLAHTLNSNTISNNNSKEQNAICIRELSTIDKFSDAVGLFKMLNVNYEFGTESQTFENAKATLPNTDLLIVSPGVPNDAPYIQIAKQLGIKIVSELEFAFKQIGNPIIAITGTNGKTTTTALTNFILNNAGINAVEAGNIGTPLSEIANQILTNPCEKINAKTVIVLEVSSYQLEFCDTFCPDIAVILNITPDHLKYHKTYENYINAKLKIAKNQAEQNVLIVNADDETLACQNILQFKNKTNIKSNIYQISLSQVERGIHLLNGNMINLMQQNKEEIMQVKEIKIPGSHNQYNSMAAAISAKVWQISNENIRDSLMKFNGVEHRLEFVKTVNEVDYLNDSKATNVNATWFALSSYENPLIWIAGGRGDNNNYNSLNKIVAKNVKHIICFGEEKEAIYSQFHSEVSCKKVENIYEAVRLAHKIAKPQDIVMFSPACKSFDQFLNFEHRGDIFKQAVNMLAVNFN